METQQLSQSHTGGNWSCAGTVSALIQPSWLSSKTFLSSDVNKIPKSKFIVWTWGWSSVPWKWGWGRWLYFSVVRLYLAYLRSFDSSLNRSWKELCACWIQLIPPVTHCSQTIHMSRKVWDSCVLVPKSLTECLEELMCSCVRVREWVTSV